MIEVNERKVLRATHHGEFVVQSVERAHVFLVIIIRWEAEALSLKIRKKILKDLRGTTWIVRCKVTFPHNVSNRSFNALLQLRNLTARGEGRGERDGETENVSG